MQVKSIDGTTHEISLDEARRIHHEMAKQHAAQHTASERQQHADKATADRWWSDHGKHSMKKFYEDYQGTAAEHIQKALGHHAPPMCENEVKGAICQALEHGDPDLIAEVIFEAMEWETAYAALKNIDE